MDSSGSPAFSRGVVAATGAGGCTGTNGIARDASVIGAASAAIGTLAARCSTPLQRFTPRPTSHWRTRFAFKRWACATPATDAPDTRHAAMTTCKRHVIQELGRQHLGQQTRGWDALVDHVRRHCGLYERLTVPARPFATHVALHREHAALVVRLLGHDLADALHLAAADAHGARRLMVHVAPRQLRRHRFAFRGLHVGLAVGDIGVDARALDLLTEFGQISIQGCLC